MSLSHTFPMRSRPRFRLPGAALVAIAASLLFGGSLLLALETPSQPFLQKNGFYLESAGFKAKFATDAAGREALEKLPSHRFVVHTNARGARYLYADPKMCVCIFVGTRENFLNYQDILRQPLPQADFVSPDYKTQSSALLSDDPIDSAGIDWQPDSLSAYLQDYY